MAKKSSPSKWYKVAKRNYARGTWTLAMLEAVLAEGRITQAEFDEITAEAEEE